jgi:hypothetical protein
MHASRIVILLPPFVELLMRLCSFPSKYAMRETLGSGQVLDDISCNPLSMEESC